LPEAQVDRFMLKLKVGYPSKEEEYKIMKRMAMTDKRIAVSHVVGPDDMIRARKVVDEIYMDERIERYIIEVIFATRDPKAYRLGDLAPLIQYGASPRASIYLSVAAKAYAFLQGRGYVVPQDVKTIGLDVLRHRVIVSYEAEAEDKTSEDIVKKVFEEVKVP
jgi:MoxR-like ATPase